MTAREFLYLVHEAATALICADSGSCSSPGFCREEAARFIAQANMNVTTPLDVTVHGFGPGQVEEVTADACLRVRVHSGSETVPVSWVAAR